MAKNELISLALIYSEPRHTYGLGTIVKEMGLERWARISLPSLYTTLSRLADAGCVEVTTERVGNMPERKVYSITDAGKGKLREELREAMVTPEMGENPFYLAATFAFGLTAAEIEDMLRERIRRLEEALAQMGANRGHLRSVGARQALVTVESGMAHLRVEIEAAQRLIELVHDDPNFYERELTRQLRAIHSQGKST